MKLLQLFLFIPTLVFSQLEPGFDKNEAKDLIQLCNTFTYLELYKDDSEMIPKDYTKTYTSPVYGMDNKFQTYRKGNTGVINFRGSTDEKSSWLENFHSAMIPAQGSIKIKDKVFDYKFALEDGSYVHSGYALGFAYFVDDLDTQIKRMRKEGVKNLIITGHSQGGAHAILTRLYIEHQKKREYKFNTIKVYTFAQPMVGNIEFVEEYDRLFCDKDESFSLINEEDLVPTLPLSFNDSTYFKSNFKSMISRNEKVDGKKLMRDGMVNMFKNSLSGTVSMFGRSIDKQIEKELGDVTLPKPTGDVNYEQVGNIIYIPVPDYPLVMKDSALLEDKGFMADHPRDSNGTFEDKRVYRGNTVAQNHKPYNYYTSILRKYFVEEYEAIEPKSFGL